MRRLNARSPDLNPVSPRAAAGNNNQMDRPQIRSHSSAFPHRYSLLSRISSKQAKGGFWISAPAAATAAAVLCLVLFLMRNGGDRRFGIIIDGGSTGTRIHVYAYTAGGGVAPVIDLGSSSAMRVTPGLSFYSGQPDAAGGSLAELMEFGRRRVPKQLWEVTEIRLMATAGLRLLDEKVQEKMLESCRKVLRSSGFRFKDDWATVITGSDEGIYAWVTANYALGSLGNDPQETTGIIELGGASAQVTFVSTEPLPPEYSHVLTFGKNIYNIYSHSFLHFGQNVAYDTVRKLYTLTDLESTEFASRGIVSDPCTPRGYLPGSTSNRLSKMDLTKHGHALGVPTSGNFTECRSAAFSLLKEGKESCLYDRCRVGSVFVPELQGKFVATENFFYTSKFFGLGSTPSLSDIIRAGEKYCGADWSKLRKKYGYLEEDALLHYCFSSAYIIALLHDSLGIALDDKRIKFTNEVSNVPLDWAMGAFIMHVTSDADIKAHSSWVNNFIRSDSSGLLFILVILSIFILAFWSASKWRTPQLKTIYDLENGRYIISRVSP